MKKKPGAAFIVGDEELDRPGVGVACRASDAHGGVEKLCPDLRVEAGRGRDFDELLVASLEAAAPLPEVRHRARCVSQHLHLDVPRAGNELLRIDVCNPESRSCLRPAPLERRRDLFAGADDAHAAAPAPGDRLDHHRCTGGKRCEEALRVVCVRQDGAAGEDGDACSLGQRPRRHLVAKEFERFGSRPDEAQPMAGTEAGEGGVLAQEPIAGMDRVAAILLRQRDDLLGVEIGCRSGTTQRDGLVALADVETRSVILSEDPDRGDIEFGRGVRDPDGDFTPVGD